SRSHAYRPTKMTAVAGTPTAIQPRKSTDRPSTSGRFRNPMASTFVAVPIGVAIPPTLAANATINSRAVANRDRANAAPPAVPGPAARTAIIPTTTGHIIAAVAVLLTHIEMNVVTTPTVARSVPGERAAHRDASTASASRR